MLLRGRNAVHLFATVLFATVHCGECFKLRASPVDVPGLSIYKESISTKIIHRLKTQDNDRFNVIHTTTTKCEGSDCATEAVTRATPASQKKALKERLVELERLVEEKEQRDLANATLTSMTKEAKKAVNHYHATLLRSAAQQIRERTSPEQMVLSNISQLLVGLTINKTMPIEAKPAKPIAQNEAIEAIDLTKLILPDVGKEDPPTLEERIDGMEQWMTKKLHGRMDAIEEKMGDKKVLTSDEKKLKIKELNENIKKELIKKMDKLEHNRRKEMMAKIKALQNTIEHGGVETSKEEEAKSGNDEHKDDNGGKDVDAGAAGGDASGASGANEEVLDGDNGEKIYTLSGDETDEEEEEDQEEGGGGGCGDAGETSLIELQQQRQKLGLPPCPIAGENGMNDVLNPSLYEGGPPNVAPLQPQKFYKATEVEAGSIDGAEIVATTDLDDPPPKTQAPQDMLPLSQIVQGSNAPKTEIVSSGTTESALEYN
jgi:hypothetical protein